MDKWDHCEYKPRISSGPGGRLQDVLVTWVYGLELTRELQIYPEILSNADAAPSYITSDTDGAQQRADDAVDEGRDYLAREHESADEPPGAATDSHGV
jgi:hypothetical protein